MKKMFFLNAHTIQPVSVYLCIMLIFKLRLLL